MPVAIPMIIGAAASSAALGAVVGGITIGTFGAALIGGVASMAASALLMPKAQMPDISSGAGLSQGGGARTQQFRQPTPAHEIVVGRIKKSGPLMFVYSAPDDTGRADGYFYVVHALAAHHCRAIGDIYLSADLSTDSKFTGLVRQSAYLGSTTQIADPDFVAETAGQWTADHRLRGRTVLYSRLKGNATAFPSGVPNISAIVWGVDEIPDPRNGSIGWTNNAILIIYWWMTWGEGYDPADFDVDTLVAAANICDERIQVATATTIFRVDYVADAHALTLPDGARSLDVGDGVRVSSSGTLPGGLAADTTYYAIPSNKGTVKLATSVANAFAGTAVTLTSDGTVASTGTGYTSDGSAYAIGSTSIALTSGSGTVVAGDFVSFTGDTALYTVTTGIAAPGTIGISPGLAVALPASAVALTVASSAHTVTYWDEARYKINGSFTLDAEKRDIRDSLLSACAGFAVEIGGIWFLHAGAAAAPTVTLDEDDLRAAMVTVPKRSMRDRFNGVRAVFVNPDNAWQPSDAPPLLSAAYYAEDNGVELYQDIRLPFTTSARAAQRLMKIHLERNRRQRTVKFPAKLTGMRLRPLDGCYISNARYDWVQEQHRVMGWVLADDGGIDLQLQEDDADIYTWNAIEEQATAAPQSLTLPDPTHKTIGGLDLQANAVGFTVSGGTTTSKSITVTNDATVSGTNTGDQTIALTGDVTGSGTGSFAATIANGAVTYAKMQNVSATDKLLGRATSGAGSVEEIALTAAGRALIDDATASDQRSTLGLGTAATLASDTDTTLAANSDARLATQKAVKTYIDGIVTGGASDVMIFKGVIDCSANPNYPAADAGAVYKVSVAGKIGGASGITVEVGDTLYCITDGTAAGTQAAVGANWVISQVNIDGAVVGPASATGNHLAVFDGTTGKLIKDGGAAPTGSNSGDQTITLTGDVTGSGTGTFATAIAVAPQTWTPALKDSAGHAYNLTYAVGTYIKLGKLCIATADMIWNSIGSANGSALIIDNMPATSQNVSASRQSATIGYMSGVDNAGGTKQIVASMDENATVLTFRQINDNAAPTDLAANAQSASGSIQLTIAFITT